MIRQRFLEGIQKGTVTLAFRRWRRPSVKSGGTLLTAHGLLHIGDIAIVALEDISNADARRAGYDSQRVAGDRVERTGDGGSTASSLARSKPIRVSRSERRRDGLGASGSDATVVPPGCPCERRAVDPSRAGAPAGASRRRAGDLCEMVGQDKLSFKINVRKLKALGLTESLEIGYRLSPRGEALLGTLQQ